MHVHIHIMLLCYSFIDHCFFICTVQLSLALLQISLSWPLPKSRLLHVPYGHMAWDASEGFPRCRRLGLALPYLACPDLAEDPNLEYL